MNAIDGLLKGAAESQAVPGVIGVVGDRDGVLYEGAFGVPQRRRGPARSCPTR